MLSNRDFQRLSEVIQQEVRLVVHQEMTKAIDSRGLVTRNEMMIHVQAIMGEIKAMREELAASLVAHQRYEYLFENHDTRIQKLELHVLETPK